MDGMANTDGVAFVQMRPPFPDQQASLRGKASLKEAFLVIIVVLIQLRIMGIFARQRIRSRAYLIGTLGSSCFSGFLRVRL